MSVRAYLCGIKGTDWHQVVNHESRGKAKAQYFHEVVDAWEDIPFTAITCRVLGPPATPESFLRTAKYRGMPDLRCGQRVLLHGGQVGTLVGSNDSANFDLLVGGRVWNVHPGDIAQVLDAQEPTQ